MPATTEPVTSFELSVLASIVFRAVASQNRAILVHGALVLIHFQGGDKGVLRNVHFAELTHLFLAGLLFL